MNQEDRTSSSPVQEELDPIQAKIEKARKQQALLKQITKLEREIATAEKKLEQKRAKLAELARQL